MTTFVVSGTDGPQATDYEKKTQREHIYEISDTYIGADVQKPRESRVMYQDTEGNFKTKGGTISFPEGAERIFIEIISNASDNLDRSIRKGVDPGTIEVTMGKHWVVIKNGGLPIPVEMHPTEKIYVPQMIFGELLTSSNYSGDRTGCGRNGYGAKLTNIYSKKFIVEVLDAARSLHYSQTWTDNMLVCESPVINKVTDPDAKSYVQVSYLMDFQRFGYDPEVGYPDEAIMLFLRHAADISFAYQTPVVFNGSKIDIFDIKEYARLQFGDAADTAVVYQNFSDKQLKGVPTVDLCILDTPASGEHVGISNGMWNRDGGNHIDAALKVIAEHILPKINRKFQRKNKDGTKAKTPQLDIRSIQNHVSILLSVHVTNSKFDSQMKLRLTSPSMEEIKPLMKLTASRLKPVNDWNLMESLKIDMDRKYLNKAKKSDGVKKAYVRVSGSEDANDAGTGKSQDCTLCIVEGKSALSYVTTMISFIERGRNTWGVMPVRGKLINTMNAHPDKINDNKEIQSLKKMLGLKEGVDYSVPANRKRLRYGHLLIMVDADVDGTHIATLILLYFYWRHRALLRCNFIKLMRTPLLRVTIGKTEHKFISRAEYESWLEEDSSRRKYKPRYFKGLGGTSDDQIKNDMNFMKQVVFLYDDQTPEFFKLAFDKELTDRRKEWLGKYQPILRAVSVDYQPISKYIDHELIEFSMADVHRSIPGFDGLKTSQRKILWAGVKKWGSSLYAGRKCKEFKVGRYANHAAEETDYSHAETAMSDTIVGMAWDFTGSNNLPYFKKAGQFGTRNYGGKDAANTRYTYTSLLPWTAKVFRKEDQALLEIHKEEGEHNEPYFFLPVIPMILVNGAQGIGTGWSSNIPCHNPADIIRWCQAWLSGTSFPPIKPWYKGFTGEIEIIRSTVKKAAAKTNGVIGTTPLPELMPEGVPSVANDEPESGDESDPLEADVQDEVEGKLTMRTVGKFHEDPEREDVVWVTDLPIGRWTHDYYEFLAKEMELKPKPKTEAAKEKVKLERQKLKAAGKPVPRYPIITGFKNHSKKDGVCFEIIGIKNPTLQKLRLVKSRGISNMTILDRNRKPIIFSNTYELMLWWCQQRYAYYDLRKQKMIAALNMELHLTSEKARFIHCVAVTQEIEIRNVSKAKLFREMEARSFDTELINKVNLANCTEDEIKKLLEKAEVIRGKIAAIEATEPKDLWLSDLQELQEFLIKKYPEFYVL